MHSGKCSVERNPYQISELCWALKLDLQGFKFDSSGLWKVHHQGWSGRPTAKSPFFVFKPGQQMQTGAAQARGRSAVLQTL